MDKRVEKLELLIHNQMGKFEKNPIRESIKILIIIWVIKKVIKWIKDQ